MNKKILSVLLCGSLLFGTVFANAVSINFEELETDNVSITYKELQAEEAITEGSVRQRILMHQKWRQEAIFAVIIIVQVHMVNAIGTEYHLNESKRKS